MLLNNLDTWRKRHNITKSEMGGKIGMAAHVNSYDYLQRNGFTKVLYLLNSEILTGLSLKQLLDHELYLRTFIFPYDENSDNIIRNLRKNLLCMRLGNGIICNNNISRQFITINFDAIMAKNNNDLKLCMEDQKKVFQFIIKSLKTNNINYENTYKNFENYKNYV